MSFCGALLVGLDFAKDHVVLVEEELGFARGERGDGAGVLGALGDDGGYFLGEQHLAGIECHDDGFLSDEG